ncbi:hypothetical protein DITRI_Ditri04bG0156800 [Diplodiscus trichospermus]
MVASVTMLSHSSCLSSFSVFLNSHASSSPQRLHFPVSLNANPTACLGRWYALFVFREIEVDEKETDLLLDKNPTLRSMSLDKIRARFLALQSIGINDIALYQLKLPAILSYSLEHMEDHVEFIRSYVGLNDPEIFKTILVFPIVINASKERKLHPRIKFLKQCGLNSYEIFKFLTRSPLFVALSFEDNLAHKLGLLVKIGYEYRTKELAVAFGTVIRASC